MLKILVCLVGFFLAFGLGILVMIFGWGLTPQSWGWIVFGGIASAFIGAFFQLID